MADPAPQNNVLVPNEVTPMSVEQAAMRRGRSLAIALVLGALVALFYAVTIVKLKGNVAKRASVPHLGSSIPAVEQPQPKGE